MLGADELAAHGYTPDLYLLATDTAVVVPVDKVVHMQVTGADVIHAWTIPAFGVKIDAVPGRLNETWFQAEQEGIYFGQCSELCGKNHGYMPITVKVVSQEAYDTWLNWAIDEYGGTRPEPPAAAPPPRPKPRRRARSRGAGRGHACGRRADRAAPADAAPADAAPPTPAPARCRADRCRACRDPRRAGRRAAPAN